MWFVANKLRTVHRLIQFRQLSNMKLPTLCSNCSVRWIMFTHESDSSKDFLFPEMCEACSKQGVSRDTASNGHRIISTNTQDQSVAKHNNRDGLSQAEDSDTCTDREPHQNDAQNNGTYGQNEVEVTACQWSQMNATHCNNSSSSESGLQILEDELTDREKSVGFGETIRKEFLLHEDSTFINNGSYGAVPRRVHDYKNKLQLQMELHPQKWFVHDFPKMHKTAIEKVAGFLGTDPEDTYLVQNVTKGCNTVIKSFPLKPGDAILVNNLTYPAVAKAALHTAEMRGAELISLDITFPIATEDELVDRFEKALQEHPNIKLAVIDHITSSTALLMPVRRLAEVCHHHGIVVLVDGAHVPGQLKVDFSEMDADYFTGNFHKWAFTPRSCAVLLQNPRRKHYWFRPLVTSCEHGTSLQEEFAYEGTKDDTAFYSVVEGIDFTETVGGLNKIYDYNVGLKQEAFNYLSSNWGTSSIAVPDTMYAPFMKLLQLPALKDFQETPEDADRLQTFILNNYSIDCKIYCRDKKLFCRLSVHIYNTLEDFRKLDIVIKELMCYC